MSAISLTHRTDTRPANWMHRFRDWHHLAKSAFMLMIFSVASCATSPNQLNYAKVEVDDRGVVKVSNHPILLEDLTEQLKKIGATPETRITITLPQDHSRKLVLDISKSLTEANFFRHKFKSRWKTSSKVSSMGQ